MFFCVCKFGSELRVFDRGLSFAVFDCVAVIAPVAAAVRSDHDITSVLVNELYKREKKQQRVYIHRAHIGAYDDDDDDGWHIYTHTHIRTLK